jgi:hypothetical protein
VRRRACRLDQLIGELAAAPVRQSAWLRRALAVDSREWHLSPGDWARTLARHARMTACGILVLHVTPAQIRAEPDRVTAEIRAALQAGQQRPALAVRARPAA